MRSAATRYFALGLLAIVILGVFAMWAVASLDGLLSSPAGALIALGQLAGLMAAVGALLQFLLMGRVGWIEGPFGLDRLADFHRKNGYATITLILIHPMLLTIGYGLNAGVSGLSQYLTFITKFPDVWRALIAQILFITVVGTSIYIVRRNLAFEQWYWVHLAVYAAIILAFAHQIGVGGTFTANPLAKKIWIGLYAFVALNVLYYRFMTIGIAYFRFGFKVDEVVHETDSAVSIYISGRHLGRWRSQAGQFVLVRFLSSQLWLQEHPFSLSSLPNDNRLRITVKNVGDYTAQLQELSAGRPVLVSGTFGTFSISPSDNPRRLFIAGGVGITPIRAMLEAVGRDSDSVLIYGNKTEKDVIFTGEIAHFMDPAKLHLVYSADPKAAGQHGYITAELLAETTPDYMTREIYLCGPPAMMSGVISGLKAANYPLQNLHYERFSLHS